MFAKWNNSWIAGALAIVITVICVIWLWKMPRETRRSSTWLAPASIGGMRIGNAVAYKAAEETTRILGAAGGSVVLVVPPVEVKEMPRQSLAASFNDGFRESLKPHSNVRVAGLVTAAPFSLNLDRLQEIQRTYPKAGVIVSFMGLPQLTESERQTWLTSNPPKMVVIEFSPQPSMRTELLTAELSNGLIQSVIAFNQPSQDLFMKFFVNPPTTRDEILKYYDVLHSPSEQ